MMLRVFLALLVSAGVAQGQTARVASGEHADFTRLVIELPGAVDWKVGRLPLGYGFAAMAPDQPTYDLSQVWDRIPRTRLQSLRVDPATGALVLTLACDCHVFPFEYRPGMIVLDVKDGAPPPGSSFEFAFEPTVEAATASGNQPHDTAATPDAYDWRSATTADADPTPALDLPTGSVSLDPLRDELLAQISRGAADGVVDMELPGKPVDHPGTEWGELPWTTIHLGEGTGVEVRAGGKDETLSPAADCLPDSDLDIAAWGKGMPPADLLSEARSSLFGEFDRIEPEAALRAVQIHLYLGFGAEARLYADLLQVDRPATLPFYVSMSHLIDGETDPATPFSGMLGCDGAAALWSALAHDGFPTGGDVNTDAILRSFLALPPHLRRHLGGPLADNFLAHDEVEAARVIRDAIERTPEANPAQVALLDARADLHSGDLPAAVAHAETAAETSADDSDSLITLVEAHFRDATPLDPDVALTLRTLLHEAGGASDEPALQRALVLALALSGDMAAAFDAADGHDLATRDLWQILPARADDTAFLTHAVLADSAPVPVVAPATAERIAARLVQLGFADAALQWLSDVGPGDLPERRELAAEAELGQGDARAAVALLQGIDTPTALSLRAQALVQLGDYASAHEALLAAGSPDEGKRLLTWQHDWAKVGLDGAQPWSDAARLVDPVLPASNAGPLGQSASLLEDSARMRAAVAALLADVPAPQD